MRKFALMIAFMLIFAIPIGGKEESHIKNAMPVEVKNYIFDRSIKIKNVSIEVKNVRRAYKNFEKMPDISPIGMGEGFVGENPRSWYKYDVRMGIFNGKISRFFTIYLFPYRYINGTLYHAEFNIHFEYEIEKCREESNYDMLIITPSSLSQYAHELASIKNENGIRAKVAVLRDILRKERARDEAEEIKYYIKEEIEKNGIKYVLLLGDVDLIPVRYVNTGLEEPDKVPTDLYYADIYDGNGEFSSWDANGNEIYGEREDNIDFLPDVYIGRLPAYNGKEASILIDKIRNFNISSMKALFIGTELFSDTTTREGEFLKDYIAENVPNLEIEKLYEIDGRANADTIAREINRGAMFVNFASHGSSSSMVWGGGSWSVSDLQLLKNGYNLPMVFAMACLTNAFDEDDCLGEEFLLTEGGGAIAYVGSTRVAYVYLEKAIKNSLSGYLDYLFFKSYYDGFNTTGSIFSGAITYYALHSPFFSNVDRLTAMEFNLLGDPSIYMPELKNTSRAYVRNKFGREIDVYARAFGYDGTAKLYYRKEGRREWNYYGESSKPYHWKFVPPEEGIYELCSIVDGENFPLYGDCYCIFDETPPEIEVRKPDNGLYFFNKKVIEWDKNLTLAIGKITIEGRVYDNLFSKVEIFANGKMIYSSFSPEFEIEWKGLKFGFYTIKIVARDVGNNTSIREMNIIRIT